MSYERDKPVSLGIKLAMFGGFMAIWFGLGFVLHLISAFYREGGWGMWPILAAGLVFIGITVERTRYLFFTVKHDRSVFVAEVQKRLLHGDVQGAVAYCNSKNLPLANIVGAGLANLNLSDSEVQDAVDEAALYELPKIEVRTGYLAMIGNIATLLGLLGTIIGLIISFAGVSLDKVNDPATQRRAEAYKDLVPACKALTGKNLVMCIKQNKATILARGISEAMHCTAFGLLVGILALLGFSVLNGRTQVMLDNLNQTVVNLMNLAVLHRKAMKV